jgi:DNA-directed RNA polymerase specialized sigma24 family protein
MTARWSVLFRDDHVARKGSPAPVLSDGELVDAVRRGDRDAFAVLVARYECAVRAVATSVLRDTHAAQDVAQEAFFAAYEKLGRLRDASSFGRWLLKIARHRAISAKRRDRQLLPPDALRIVVMLYYFNQYNVHEVAAMLSRPVGTVTVQLCRARKQLQRQLETQKS